MNPCDYPQATALSYESVPTSHAAALAERLALLEQEKLDLQKLICELLAHNEELRRRIQDLWSQMAAHSA